MSIGQRLRQAIQNNCLTLKDFSEKSQIPYRTLQQYLNDSRVPGGASLIKLNASLGISTDWLLTGKDSMFKSEQINPTPKWLNDWWQQADEKHRIWLEIQLNQTPPTTQ